MSRIDASVTLHLTINDPQELWDSARTHCADASDADAIDMIGERADPDLSACLRMIFDPGTSPAGCSIEDSSADIAESLECAMGMHSWIDQVGKLPADTACTRCGETYGEPA